MSDFVIIRLLEAELLHAKIQMDGQTDIYDGGNSRCSQCCEQRLNKD
jgi:hypothetical protein